MSGSGERVTGVDCRSRLWVVAYKVISLASHQLVFTGIRLSYWLFHHLAFL